MSLTPHHFEPNATEGVVDQKLNDVAWREELIPNGKVGAISGCYGLAIVVIPCALPIKVTIEVLVYSSYGFVFAPNGLDFRSVQNC